MNPWRELMRARTKATSGRAPRIIFQRFSATRRLLFWQTTAGESGAISIWLQLFGDVLLEGSAG